MIPYSHFYKPLMPRKALKMYKHKGFERMNMGLIEGITKLMLLLHIFDVTV